MFDILRTLGIMPKPIQFGVDPATIIGGVKLGSKLLGGLFGKSEEEKRAEAARALDEERKGAFDLQDAQRLAAEEVAHGNTESGRTNRADILGTALGRTAGGDFAQSDAIRAKGQEERGFEGFAREYMPGASAETDVGKGAFDTITDTIGDAAGSYLKGLGADDPNEVNQFGDVAGDVAGAGEIPESSLRFLTQNNRPPGR